MLTNLITLDAPEEQFFLDAWTDDAIIMKRQAGLISTQLHLAIGQSPTYLNDAVWESMEI